MFDELTVLASELPVVESKEDYKYWEEITGNGAYFQVAWEKKKEGYIELYGTKEIDLFTLPEAEFILEFLDDEEDFTW